MYSNFLYIQIKNSSELYKKQPVLICSVIHYFRSKILESVPFVERSRNIPPLAVKNIGAKHS